MKVIDDYCDHCNSQRTVVELDNEAGEPIFNICLPCLKYAESLFVKNGVQNPLNWWDTSFGVISDEDRKIMNLSIIANSLKGNK